MFIADRGKRHGVCLCRDSLLFGQMSRKNDFDCYGQHCRSDSGVGFIAGAFGDFGGVAVHLVEVRREGEVMSCDVLQIDSPIFLHDRKIIPSFFCNTYIYIPSFFVNPLYFT